MTKEGSIKIVNFMTLRAGVLMLRRDHTSHYSEYVVSSTPSVYSTLIAIVLRDYDASFYTIVNFIYSMMGLLIYKYEPYWQEVSGKSLFLRCPLRSEGLLFFIKLEYCFQMSGAGAWVRALAPQAEGWEVESQPPQTLVVKKVMTAPLPNARQ